MSGTIFDTFHPESRCGRAGSRNVQAATHFIGTTKQTSNLKSKARSGLMDFRNSSLRIARVSPYAGSLVSFGINRVSSMPNTLINGIDVYYEISGAGSPLLFLNGSGSTVADVRQLLRPFAAHFHVVIADYRGLGRTGVPETPYTMAELASDALGLVDQLGWRTFSLVGISFGGMVAQELAVTSPGRLQRLALMCTSSGGAGGSSYPLHELAQLPPEQRITRSMQLVDTRFTPDWLAAHPRDRALLEQMAQRRSAEPTGAVARGVELQMEARASHDVFDRLSRITCPTLVASGRFDGIAPPENGEAIAAEISAAEVRLYDGGHAFFQQDPAALPDVIGALSSEPE
jgi:3-oxoadipate enol-lactonase